MTVSRLCFYYCWIMADRLPEWFDPREFVEKKRRIKGKVPLGAMDRVRDALLSTEGVANLDLVFHRQGRVAAVVGRVEADLVLRCQCCLGALAWPVRSEVSLGVVASLDEADRLPEEFDALVVAPGSEVALAEIVQDELVLAIPPIPQHVQCGVPKPQTTSESGRRPFDSLAQLKKHQP